MTWHLRYLMFLYLIASFGLLLPISYVFCKLIPICVSSPLFPIRINKIKDNLNPSSLTLIVRGDKQLYMYICILTRIT